MLVDCLTYLGAMLFQIMSITLPFGVSFGVLIVGFIFMCVLVSIVRAVFTGFRADFVSSSRENRKNSKQGV